MSISERVAIILIQFTKKALHYPAIPKKFCTIEINQYFR